MPTDSLNLFDGSRITISDVDGEEITYSPVREYVPAPHYICEEPFYVNNDYMFNSVTNAFNDLSSRLRNLSYAAEPLTKAQIKKIKEIAYREELTELFKEFTSKLEYGTDRLEFLLDLKKK